MNYCFTYIRHSQHLHDVDELNVKFDDLEDLDALQRLLTEYAPKDQPKRVNIVIPDPKELTKNDLYRTFCILGEKYNIALQLYEITRQPSAEWRIPESVVALVKSGGVSCYYGIIAETSNYVNYLADCGASEIYLGGDNGFNLTHLTPYLHNQNVKIRVLGNYVFEEPGVHPMAHFFIRPEDEAVCSLIDTIELIATNPSLIDGIFEAYRDHSWYGSLKEIVYNLKADVNNRHFYPYGWNLRSGCRRTCQYGGCSICPQLLTLSQTFKDKDVFITPPEAELLENDKKI